MVARRTRAAGGLAGREPSEERSELMRKAVFDRWPGEEDQHNDGGVMASRSRPMSRSWSRLSLAPVEAARRRFLNVVGVSMGKSPRWRWRIANGLGEILRESAASFPTLLSALADGRRTLVTMRD